MSKVSRLEEVHKDSELSESLETMRGAARTKAVSSTNVYFIIDFKLTSRFCRIWCLVHRFVKIQESVYCGISAVLMFLPVVEMVPGLSAQLMVLGPVLGELATQVMWRTVCSVVKRFHKTIQS